MVPAESANSTGTSPGPDDRIGETLEAMEKALQEEGVGPTLQSLLCTLEERRLYKELFDAMLLCKRHELGLPLVQVGPATEMPEEFVEPFEESIAAACRKVGRLLLEAGDLVRAWPYLRAIGDSECMRAAIERVEPGTRRKDVDGIIEIALHEAVHPARGLELVLHQYGICSTITNFEQFQTGMRRGEQESCVRILVRALHAEVRDNVRAEVAQREGSCDAECGLLELIETRPDLFEHDAYYADSSHVHAVVRLAGLLPDGAELDQAVELCEYGRRLAKVYQFESGPPFDDYYTDQGLYLRGVREAHLPHSEARRQAADLFVARARQALDDRRSDYPVDQALTLLARLRELDAAVEIAEGFESLLGPHHPLSPGVFELCQMGSAFETMQRVARQRGDLVHFAAGLVQSRKPPES